MRLLLNLDVPDLSAAVAFYQQALGFSVGRVLFDGTVVEMLGAAVPLYLLHKAAATRPCLEAGVQRDYRRHWMPLHLDLVVDDLDAALARAVAAGARQEGDIHEYDWGRLVTLSDPFGHGLCLLQWLEEGYDLVTTHMGEIDAQN
ncbi:VOC family protein [Ectopseudomonas toyotomiensis]|uniref:VOC family protein n=1 Tax=Ectopseudomonas toyotomiensis TaxID=554344 RepID=A0AA42IL68_9GAMM|nr:VOC family protein [Pseudomonas toyotomiensis]MBG0839532.1 VOC family protein [Pseudomonas toyotomiensis]MDH0701572.1 VOC family protein [Pseudomonas toyotomiensis]